MTLTKEQIIKAIKVLQHQRDDKKVHFNNLKNYLERKYKVNYEWEDFTKMILDDNNENFSYYSGFIRLKDSNSNEEHYKILDFLSALRGLSVSELYTDEEFVNSLDEKEQEFGSSYEITREIFLKGNCGNVYKMLKVFYPEAKPCLLNNPIHIITLINGRFYDIDGEVRLNIEYPTYTILDEIEVDDYVNNYSFHTRGPIL